jgi:hypothetical protein
MRLLFLLFLISCSTPLKYKHLSSDRTPASGEGAEVSSIEIYISDDQVFANGMDSTYLMVKLFDESGVLITGADPSELSISSSEDLKAKPFSLRQGVYKAEILPRVKSPWIEVMVDWKELVFSPKIKIKTSMAPKKNHLRPVNNDYFEHRSYGEVTISRGENSPENITEEFSFDNMGPNKIVSAKDSYRDFRFSYLEQARQNIAMEVDDAPNDTVSHTMHSIFMFFPRKIMPVVEQLAQTLQVTLPTGELMIFNRESNEVIGGVFEEGPVDVSSDRFKRHYADLRYKGKGVLLRVNARGQSPQLGQFENLKIDTEFGIKGSADVLIINGSTGQRCRRPKADFWEPIDVNPIEFKFATDESFDSYLKKNCGFGIPKL